MLYVRITLINIIGNRRNVKENSCITGLICALAAEINVPSIDEVMVSTEMGDRVRVQFPVPDTNFGMQPTSHSMPTQPSIPPGSVNEYQLRLEGKGRYGSFR